MLRLAVLMASAALAMSLAIPTNFKVGVAPAGGKNWAVLVAGSNTWGNYRHQADICHSYQVLRTNGFDDNNIIVMMYDDIANNAENPKKGNIINQPNGPNVYPNVRKDYTGAAVTPANFLKVLKGESTGKRVLASGPNDNVFVFFSDHGGPGIIAFPSELLQATDLIAALKYMNTNKMYNQLVFYLEACESGSMFDGLLPANINIYATTASDPTTSSYACYYDETLQTYLGDVYSVNWLQDSDRGKLKSETLTQQYAIVKKETNTSTVEQYGELSIASTLLDYFQAGPNGQQPFTPAPRVPITDAVDSREVPVEILKHKIARASPAQRVVLEAELGALYEERARIDATYTNIITRVAGSDKVDLHFGARIKPSVVTTDCLRMATQTFHEVCFNYGKTEYALKNAKTLTSLCAAGYSTETVVGAITAECSGKPLEMKFVSTAL